MLESTCLRKKFTCLQQDDSCYCPALNLGMESHKCHSFFHLVANTDQIDSAKEILKKLQFTYSSESFENPVLQKHWRNIEALALDRDSPEEMTDYTCKTEQANFYHYMLLTIVHTAFSEKLF